MYRRRTQKPGPVGWEEYKDKIAVQKVGGSTASGGQTERGSWQFGGQF